MYNKYGRGTSVLISIQLTRCFKGTPFLGEKRGERSMAKTAAGKKIVEVRSHIRHLPNGKTVRVREHRKSPPHG